MEYDNNVNKLAETGDQEERSQVLIKGMCRVIEDIINYNRTKKHYQSDNLNNTVVTDNKNKIKNSLAILQGDLDVYAEMLSIRKDVISKTHKRIKKIADKASKY